MSLVYSSTSLKNGIVQGLERVLKLGDGGITGDSQKFAEFNADINLALDRATRLIIEADGTWQWDDSNYTGSTGYPIVYTNLVSGQRDYAFTVDAGSNVILQIHKVAILPSATATLYQDVMPIDQQTDSNNDIVTENTTTGVPFQYDKTGTGIFLDPKPSYNATNGLKVWINREASYFTVSDTTKKPGFAGIFHEYLVLQPAYQYAIRNSLSNTTFLRDEVMRMEKAITDYYGRREKDIRRVMTGKKINYI